MGLRRLRVTENHTLNVPSPRRLIRVYPRRPVYRPHVPHPVYDPWPTAVAGSLGYGLGALDGVSAGAGVGYYEGAYDALDALDGLDY